MRKSPCRAAVVLLSLVFGAATACDSTPVSPSTASGTVLAADVRAALEAAIVDEYRAETIYEGVVADFGQARPFANVLTAEQRHSAALAGVMIMYGLFVPSNPWTSASVPHFASVPQACSTAAGAERDNIAMYDRFLLLDLPADARRVFESNRAASLFNHLAAFEGCAAP